ncbi:MAG: transcription antitermination factor NusB [Bryobacteraceae bacterium]
MPASARQIAFDVLLAVAGGAPSGDALDRALAGLDSREAGLATEIVYGVLRRRAQLQALIARVSSRRPEQLDPRVLIAIEIGAYQMRYLDRVPDHAAVSESVELAKRARKTPAAALVNAVLRRLPPLPSAWGDDALEYSLPSWLWRRWASRFGLDAARRLGKACLHPPATYVRLPGVAEPPPGCEPAELPGCWRVTGPVPPGARRQDIGSQTVVPLLELQPGHLFLDLCAAPGNKTAQALETPGLTAVACDTSAARLREFHAAAARLVRLDAAQPLPFPPVFDRILVDAPCSGTGTLARNPELRWRLKEADFARHAQRQRRILSHALNCLKPGGRLVYSTCSLEREENEDVVRAVAPDRVRAERLRVPGRHAGDGFYAAVLT